MTKASTHTVFIPSAKNRENLTALYDECRAWLAALCEQPNAPVGELLRPLFGVGNHHARVLLIGEAPGRFETEQGVPFVGKAGENLNAFLADVGFSREELFITNAVKYRPFRVNAKGGKANRTPARAELLALRELLLCEITAVNPSIVVTLGNSPLFALTGKANIGASHGVPQPLSPGKTLFPLYHPASLIYNPSLRGEYEKNMSALHQFAQNQGF